MLHEFLLENEREILAMTEQKSLELAGVRPSSVQLKQGLPIFYKQLMTVLQLAQKSPVLSKNDTDKMGTAAANSDEPALALASLRPDDIELAKAAGRHGVELLRLGYTLSHVVHAYGSMCQAITELANKHSVVITAHEFHDLNRCLDVAIAGAVTEFQALRNTQEKTREVEHLGFLAHELRNALSSVTMSSQLIKRGLVGFGGSTGQVFNNGLKRIEELIDRSLTEVRLRVDPKVHPEPIYLLQLVDQIVVTAGIQAGLKHQKIEVQVDPTLVFDADQPLFYSALSNLIQNALKYTHEGGKVQVRGKLVGDRVIVEVEDECGGLPPNVDLFKSFEQRHGDRSGLGLGLTIVKRAVGLNHGTVDVHNSPGRGCVFSINLPKIADSQAEPAA